MLVPEQLLCVFRASAVFFLGTAETRKTPRKALHSLLKTT